MDLEQMKQKYATVLSTIQQQQVRLSHVICSMLAGGKVPIRSGLGKLMPELPPFCPV